MPWDRMRSISTIHFRLIEVKPKFLPAFHVPILPHRHPRATVLGVSYRLLPRRPFLTTVPSYHLPVQGHHVPQLAHSAIPARPHLMAFLL